MDTRWEWYSSVINDCLRYVLCLSMISSVPRTELVSDTLLWILECVVGQVKYWNKWSIIDCSSRFTKTVFMALGHVYVPLVSPQMSVIAKPNFHIRQRSRRSPVAHVPNLFPALGRNWLLLPSSTSVVCTFEYWGINVPLHYSTFQWSGPGVHEILWTYL